MCTPAFRQTIFRLICTLIFGAALGHSAAAVATLIPRVGGNAVYDTDLNVTWVSDANLFASNSFGEMCCFNSVHDNGAMWYAAVIDRVFAMNRAEYLGASNWRVPTLDEFTHLFYAELGGTPGHSLMGNHGPFINIQSRYYSSTFVDVHDHCTFGFLFGDGFCFGSDSSFLYGWPVRNGDLSPVPEPTMWLWVVAALVLTVLRGRSTICSISRSVHVLRCTLGRRAGAAIFPQYPRLSTAEL